MAEYWHWYKVRALSCYCAVAGMMYEATYTRVGDAVVLILLATALLLCHSGNAG